MQVFGEGMRRIATQQEVLGVLDELRELRELQELRERMEEVYAEAEVRHKEAEEVDGNSKD